MNFLYEGIRRFIDLAYMLCGDYGIAIVLITLGIRLCLVPLGQKQRQAVKRQQELGLKAEEIREYCRKKGVEISSLAYYPNTMERDEEKRKYYINHIYRLMDASALLGVNMITTFIGRDP